ncbi:B12-binding domain-containing radical SAM protein [Caulobacter sp. S45]|uniref:B12-binding domain-containing radical SAM protein n=1 Tax=Caulobacter sp. S45 TaxID=1641861 RepID=UPI00210FB5EF|nr:radical SAM protein [Caulobacter sp. S45]
MKPYSPLSTLILASMLRDNGHQVAMFDATFATGVEDFAAALEAHRPTIVVVMEDNFNFLTKMCTTTRRETALAMVGAARARGSRVVVNGPDAADHPALYLAAGAEAVALGEGEMAVAELVRIWAHAEGSSDDVAGLVLPGSAGLITTRPRGPIRDLDGLPPPAWDLLDIEAYRRAWRGAHGEFSWNMASSRGCPYTCNWCAKPTFGRRYTVRSPADVVREIARLKVGVAPDHIWFADDIFGLDVDWTTTLAQLIEDAGCRIPFTLQSRVNLMTDAMVDALARAGAREVWLGVESGSQKVLDAMDKGATVEAARTATRTLKAHGVRACWFIQLGYPSENWEDILSTRDLIRAERPDEIGVSVAYPLPGTEFHAQVQAQLGRQRNWKDTGELAMLFQGAYSTALYRKVRNVLHAEVEAGVDNDGAWSRLEVDAHHHRSPRPFQLSLEA